jgi:hypothetical protein
MSLTRPIAAASPPPVKTIGIVCVAPCSARCCCPGADEQVGRERHQLGCGGAHSIRIAGAGTLVSFEVATLDPPQRSKPLRESGPAGPRQLVGLAAGVEKAEPPHALGRLRVGDERPRGYSAAEQRDVVEHVSRPDIWWDLPCTADSLGA